MTEVVINYRMPTLEVNIPLKKWLGNCLVGIVLVMVASRLPKTVTFATGVGLIVQALGIGILLAPLALWISKQFWQRRMSLGAAFRLITVGFLAGDAATYILDFLLQISNSTSSSAHLVATVGGPMLVPTVVWATTPTGNGETIGLKRSLQLSAGVWIGFFAIAVGWALLFFRQ